MRAQDPKEERAPAAGQGAERSADPRAERFEAARAALCAAWEAASEGWVLELGALPPDAERKAPFCEWALAKNRPEGSKRRTEFFAGRELARAALQRLGCSPAPLHRSADGQIRWPSGTTGSVSHSGGLGAALVGATPPWRGLGIDLETRVQARPGLARRILRPEERALYESLSPEARPRWLLAAFSAKESLYKATVAASGISLSWQHAELEGGLEDGALRARLHHPEATAALGTERLNGVLHRSKGFVVSAFGVRKA